jgi:DNA-binding response OmpR family regulator
LEILIAEDDPGSRRMLELTLARWGYPISSAENGEEAWRILQGEGGPSLAIVDWMMPGVDGLEICRRVRALVARSYVYVILLTARITKDDVATGFAAGADDYICKPFDQKELLARIRVGERVISLEKALAKKVEELETSLSQVRQLKDLLPICMYCKRIRDDQDYWHRIEAYIHDHTGADFSHGICPDCYAKGLGQPTVVARKG